MSLVNENGWKISNEELEVIEEMLSGSIDSHISRMNELIARSRDKKDAACIFSEGDSAVYIDREDYLAANGVAAEGQKIGHPGSRIYAMPGGLGGAFGNEYYVEKSLRELKDLTKEQWQTMMDGQICSTGDRLNVTPYQKLKDFIEAELGDLFEEPGTPVEGEKISEEIADNKQIVKEA